MASMMSFAQTVIPITNPDFETGVDATTWAATTGAPITPALVQEGWEVVSSGTYEGEISIQSANVNSGSGALKIVTNLAAGSTNAKLRSSVVTYTPAAPISGLTVDMKYFAISGTSGNARPKVNILYDIDGGTFSGKILSGRINPLTSFTEVNTTADPSPIAPVVITDPINTNITIQFEVEFGQATADIFLDDLEITITEGTTLSSQDFKAKALNIFPNPVNNVLNFSDNDVKTASVFNLLGQKIMERSVTNKLNVESLTKGVYLLQLKNQDESGLISRKFVKN